MPIHNFDSLARYRGRSFALSDAGGASSTSPLVDAGLDAAAREAQSAAGLSVRDIRLPPAFAKRLPAAAVAKLDALYQAQRDEVAISRQLQDDMDKCRQAEIRAEQYLGDLLNGSGGSFRSLREDDPRVIAARAELDSIKAEKMRISERMEIISGRRQAFGALYQNTTNWLAKLPRALKVKPHIGPAIELRKSENLTDAIETRRRRLRELVADREQTEAAPYPSSVAKQIARKQLAELAEAGSPNVMGTIDRGEPLDWPKTPVSADFYPVTAAGGGVVGASTVNGLAVLAWLCRDAMIAAVENEIDNHADDANALTDDQRSAKFAEIARDMLAVEREEEAFLERLAASSGGSVIVRRADADPRAVLGLSGELPPPQRNE